MYQKIISFQDNNILFTLCSTIAILSNKNCAKRKSFEESDSVWGISRCGGSGRKRNSETEETGTEAQGQKETGQFSTLRRGQYGCPQREKRSWVQDEVQA